MYQIDEIARRTGLTKRTIRYYEEVGLIPPSQRSEGGYRLYDEGIVERIGMIVTLKEQMGISLEAIRSQLDLDHRINELKSMLTTMPPEARLSALTELDLSLAEVQEGIKERIGRLEALYEAYAAKRERIARYQDKINKGNP